MEFLYQRIEQLQQEIDLELNSTDRVPNREFITRQYEYIARIRGWLDADFKHKMKTLGVMKTKFRLRLEDIKQITASDDTPPPYGSSEPYLMQYPHSLGNLDFSSIT